MPTDSKKLVIDNTQQLTQDIQPKQAYQCEIKQSQVKSFNNAIYGAFQLLSQDLPDLTDKESDNLGELIQPVMQDKLGNSSRGKAVIAVGGTTGILVKKIKEARTKKKERLEKKSTANPDFKLPNF